MLDYSQASCLNEDPDMFFSNDDYLYDKKTVAKAKLICRGCPIKDACLAEAMSGRYQGIWGGLTESDRTRRANGTDQLSLTSAELSARRENNKKRTAYASAKIEPYLKKALIIFADTMPEETVDIIKTRLAYPDVSLGQLGNYTSIKLTKDGISGRLRRAVEDVKKFEKKQKEEEANAK